VSESDLAHVLDRFLNAHPRPGDRDRTEDELKTAIDTGVDPDQLIRAAKAYRDEQAGNKRQYVAYSENWLAKKGWESHSQPPPTSVAEVNQATATLIRTGRDFLCVSISAFRARELMALGLVTAEECLQVGIRV